jgi:hypothetical protein
VRLIWTGLTEIDPLFNSLVLFPCIIACESFHTWKVWATVKYLILLLEYLKSFLSGLIFVGSSLNLFEESLLSDYIFVLFNNICMTCRKTLSF